MLVRECMTIRLITVHPESDPLAALGLCKSARIRRLPVVDAGNRLVGLVTRNMLEQFLAKAPSPGVMKRQHSIAQVMTEQVITVAPDYPLEEAARLMVANKIGSLPVIADGILVGIITETDIFKQFVDILGGQKEAVRLTVVAPDVPGLLAQVAGTIAARQGNIRSVVITRGIEAGLCAITLWVEQIEPDTLKTALQDMPNVQRLRLWTAARDQDPVR
jgi:acetoin utilization protein AcuB